MSNLIEIFQKKWFKVLYYTYNAKTVWYPYLYSSVQFNTNKQQNPFLSNFVFDLYVQ